MGKRDAIFLTVEEALEAVCLDFRRYEPQVMLFGEVLRVISDGGIVLKSEPGKSGRWVASEKGSKMVWFDGEALRVYVCDIVKSMRPGADAMAAVCSRVFRERAVPAVDPATGEPGVCIETGMEKFVCVQCGNCCKALDYHDALTEQDVEMWKEAQRYDILAWVGVAQKKGGASSYRIWKDPKTGELADQCPFLTKVPDKNRWICRIHDIKPRICRDYPVSRKHGVMTGCRGFDR